MALVVSWINSAISAGGYAGIAGLMAIESACLPLPSEIIMPFAGYLVSTGHLSLVTAATAGAIGCNIGSTVAYLIGAHGGRTAVLRWGRYVFFSEDDLTRFDSYFARYGSAAVFISRLLPVVRTFISLPAGIARMPFIKFQAYTFAGSWPWCFGLAYLGLQLGEQWNKTPAVQTFFHRFDWLIAILFAGSVAFYLYRHVRPRV
ncbi:MAG: DedA family protein [Proteobacteria bacterium]|nr:DedA family protein [Pseudomonadota bacterium]